MTPNGTDSLSSVAARLTAQILTVFLLWAGSAAAQTLQGSAASLDRQNHQARAHGFSYLQTPQQVRSFVDSGYLVPVVPNRDFDLHQVSFPYARPEVRLFIERLAAQYRSACGEKLVVTSLTRPISNQPPNASVRSVHPTGMAVDLRRSASARCRSWLESTLLSLEAQGVLEAIYERNPPHYHVAVYPQPYAQHVARLAGGAGVVASALSSSPAMEAQWVTHRVVRGETLSSIANRYGVAISRIRAENRIQGDRILVGQQLRVPVYVPVPATQVAAAPRPEPSPPEPVVAASTGLAPSASNEAALAEAASVGPGSVHTVARGESLWSIAQAYGISESLLRGANGIQGSRILAGQSLIIPATQGGDGVIRYTVQNGDSLWVIANRLGASVDEIRARNGMNSTRIYAGQVLDVPLTH